MTHIAVKYLVVAAMLVPAGIAVAQTPPRPPRPAAQPRPAPVAWPVPEIAPLPDFEFDLDRFTQEWDRSALFERSWDMAHSLVSEIEWQHERWPVVADQFPLGRHLTLGEPRAGSQDPSDSAYRAARSTLNRGEYRRASEEFAAFVAKYPQSRYRSSAVYWQAFSLYRAGTDADLRRALTTLDELTRTSTTAAKDADVQSLTTRVLGALATRGDASASTRLRSGASGEASCDREETEVRAEALSALVQNDPAGATTLLARILERRDECSVPLRRRAVYLLGKDGDPARLGQVLAIARTDPSPEVRSDAISRLAQVPGDEAIQGLEGFLTPGADERTQRAVIQTLRRRDDPAAARLIRRTIERTDLEEAVRVEAISSLVSCCGVRVAIAPSPTSSVRAVTVANARQGQAGERTEMADADVALLRRVYGQSDSRRIKTAIVEVLARAGGSTSDTWLVELVRNQNEDIRYRATALNRLRRSEAPVEELARLYDALTERELRSTLVRILGDREEPAATDKLVEIVRTGTDPSIRRAAISALSKKKDERTMRLLRELVEK